MKQIFANDNDHILKLRNFKLNKFLVFIISLAFVIIIGFLDYITGFEISFSIFFLIPITFAVFFSDVTTAIAISVLSALSWCLADMQSGHFYGHPLVPVWNTLMRFGYFLLHSIILDKSLTLYNRVKLESITDPLTRSNNSMFFREFLARELHKSVRSDDPFTLAYFDLDNFKLMNDRYGHQAGDSLLKLLSSLIRDNIRPYDVFARMGGDEFVLFFPETGYDDSDALIRRINDIVAEEINIKNWPVTLSIGAATYTTFNWTIEEMISKADELMYSAKKKGKNRIVHVLVDGGQAPA